MLDILQTGKYGVLANQKLLGTTSNNITNVNTAGYTRQDTIIYTSAIDWGIGSIVTRRMYDQYSQRELFRDQGNVGFYEAYSTGLGTVDTLLSKEDTSISTQLNSFFNSMQEAVQNASTQANRTETLTHLKNLVDRYHTLNYNINNELRDVNAKVGDTVKNINDLVKGIYEVNRQVRNLGKAGEQSDVGMQLMDKRDQLVNELSQYVDVSITTEEDGSYSLYLGNGQLLVNGDTYGTLNVQRDELDNTRRSVSLTFDTPTKTELFMANDGWGGKLGGYLMATDELRQSMRELGQSALALADALNEQNKGGLTLDGKPGQDLITIPNVKAASSNKNLHMTVKFNEGEGSQVRSCDYAVEFDSKFQPGGVKIFTVDSSGKKTELDQSLYTAADDPVTGNLVIKVQGNGKGNLSHGVTFEFSAPGNTLVQDGTKFLAQPTMNLAAQIKANITKPEDFAFASVLRVQGHQHAGDAVAEFEGVYNTGEGSAFERNADGALVLKQNAPKFIQYNENADAMGNPGYVIYSDDPAKGGIPLGWAPADTNGQNIFANATWNEDGKLAGAGQDGWPGYEVSFTGTVSHGSSFSIEPNTDAKNDNSNGNLLAGLASEELVFSGENVYTTFTQDYADLTADIGSAVMSSNSNYNAAFAKMEQSYNLFYSKAGVNLDEEAANLIRYQQSYSACAKIINASQTIFDALINAI